MNRTFLSENDRKNKLFEAWNEYLDILQDRFTGKEFDELYEGTATISDVTKNTFGVRLDDGRSIRHIPINPKISSHCCHLDTVFITLVKMDKKWWPLEIISIGSYLNYQSQIDKSDIHFSVNPRLIEELKISALH